MLGKKKVAVIGAGFMGGAIIRGLLRAEAVSPKNLMAADPHDGGLTALREEFPDAPATTADNKAAAVFADVLILAVKPGLMNEVLTPLKRSLGKKTVVISIAAGVTTEAIEALLPAGARVIRAMPNMGAAVGQSATALAAGKNATDEDVRVARELFDAVGETVAVDENMMDIVTGLAGSGPAYVFLFLEGLVDAGVKGGLTRAAARTLAEQTLYGAARLAKITGDHPGVLSDRITSPGGTTIAGLQALENRGFKGTVMEAVEAATRRSKELGN
jgi:pyrroline-5-carboxylate reductase